jgi:nitrite reductase/ring-hydroxylating ferredoxin subunit
MPDLNLAPQALCDASQLAETGDAFLFEVIDLAHGGQPSPAFAVRHDNQVLAYLNRCAHIPTEMDWLPGKFWDMDRRYLICAVHGALYNPPDGLCVSGPCTGARLQAIRVSEADGQVCWYPDERFQPVF